MPQKIRLFDESGREAREGDLIEKGDGTFMEVYWDEKFQWSFRPESVEKGFKTYQGTITTSKFIVNPNEKWEIIF